MPKYVINIDTDIIVPSLDGLEDVVYDYLIKQGASTATVEDGGGVTDVAASYN